MAAVFFFYAKGLNNEIRRSVNLWAVSYSLGLLSILLISLRGFVPNFFSIIVANTLNMLSLCMILAGLQLFFGKPHKNRRLILLVIFYGVLFTIFTYIFPSYRIRSMVFGLTASCVNISIALLTASVRRAESSYRYTSFATVFFVLAAIVHLTRAVTAVFIHPGFSLFSTSLHESYLYLLLLLTIIGQSMGLALLISSKINILLEKQNSRLGTLITEMNHRTKNNLALISSLISLKIGETENGEIIEALEIINSKIFSIQLVHDKLTYNEDASELHLLSYMENLISEILNFSSWTGSTIKYSIKCPDIKMPVKRLVLLALIINELVLNSMKHVFSLQKSPEIKIELSEINNNLVFNYDDSGPGIDFKSVDDMSISAGLGLIKILAEQLSGLIQTEGYAVRTFKLSFPRQIRKVLNTD